MQQEADRFITLQEVASMFSIGMTTVYEWSKAGKLPPIIKPTKTVSRMSLRAVIAAQKAMDPAAAASEKSR